MGMTEALDNACNKIVDVLRTVSGVGQVPYNPTSIQSYPLFGLVYPSDGTFTVNPIGTKKGLHNIAVDFLTKEIDPARAMANIKPYIDLVALKLIREVSYDSDSNPGGQFSNSIQTFASLTYNYLANVEYAGVPVTGYHFSMNEVKILSEL
jgi:hypothetical protein